MRESIPAEKVSARASWLRFQWRLKRRPRMIKRSGIQDEDFRTCFMHDASGHGFLVNVSDVRSF